ncbi:Uncharacterised protein [Raoultella ornithinolytica]|nr:Uncharacterised protein [Raoultella ornithinolytica]
MSDISVERQGDMRLPVTVLSGFLGAGENDPAQPYSEQQRGQARCGYRQ